jgi:predicted RNase H-like nuclease
MGKVLGLDWISAKVGWACAQLTRETASDKPTELTALWEVRLCVVPFGAENSELLQSASRIVLDAPIGLHGLKPEGCCLRDCDRAAKKWIGTQLQSSVFAVPYQGELDEWRARHTAGQKQLQGHFRGLLPAIHSADLIRTGNLNTLESHPELVFASLLGKPLPAFAAKSTLFWACVRLGLIAKHLFKVPLGIFVRHGRIPTDNFIDAIGMAVVAAEWAGGRKTDVLCDLDGTPQPLGDDPMHWPMTMAVPHTRINPVGKPLATEEELIVVAQNWMRQSARLDTTGVTVPGACPESPS